MAARKRASARSRAPGSGASCSFLLAEDFGDGGTWVCFDLGMHDSSCGVTVLLQQRVGRRRRRRALKDA
jgi:hypothetical protein